MQSQTTNSDNAQSNTHASASKTLNNNSNSNNLIQRKLIEGSPFYIVKQIMDNDKEKYFMIMGDYRLTEPTETEKEQLEKLITEHWNIIANIVAITCEKMLQLQLIELEKIAKQSNNLYKEQMDTTKETLNLMGFGDLNQ